MKDLNKWEIHLAYGFEYLILLKMSILSILTYKFIIISADFLIEIEKLVLKFV